MNPRDRYLVFLVTVAITAAAETEALGEAARMKRIMAVRCKKCETFAYGAHTEPVERDSRWHHPACPELRK